MRLLLAIVLVIPMLSACQKNEEPPSSMPTPAGPAAAPAETPAH
jgi:hypothetical protein